MNHYYKRRWDESRGDEYHDWGASWWLFETDDRFWPQRQIETYDSGPVLFYSQSHLEDDFGGLGRAALDPSEFESFRITEEAFEREWSTLKPFNAI